jgi:small conductance mechanosensitive channel
MLANIVVDSFHRFYDDLINKLPSILTALVVFIVFYLLARVVRAGTRKAFSRLSTTAHVDILISRILSYMVTGVGTIVALGILGINMGALIASLGLVTVGLGFAMKDIVSNFLAGFILILQKTYLVGDSIAIGDVEGKVEDIRIRDTILRRPDGRLVFVPNNNIFTSAVTNNTAAGHLRNEIALPLRYRDDIEEAIRLIRSCLEDLEGVLADPPATVGVEEIVDERILVKVAYWTELSADAFQIKTQTILKLTHGLAAAGFATCGGPAPDPVA